MIIQTNVYPNAQKRKVRPFEGMIRKAIVIVPSDEDYKARIEAQEKEETKDVPDNAVMEMKGIAKTTTNETIVTLNIESNNSTFTRIKYTKIHFVFIGSKLP